MVDVREALVFDYDGVVANTEPLHWKSWAILLSRYGVELPWEEYCRIGRGVSDRQMYEHFRARMSGVDEGEFIRQNSERKRLVRELSLKASPIAPQTIALLKSLEDHRLGLVTSSERADVKPILQAAGISELFDAMVFGDDVAAPKPSPAPYLIIAERLGVKTGFAFEDSEAGLESARSAGFRSIRVERPEDLPELVKRIIRG